MKLLTRHQLRTTIPVIVFLGFSIVSVGYALKHILTQKEETERNIASTLNIQMFQLQNTLSDILSLGLDDIARRHLAAFYLDPRLRLLVVADESGQIIYANRRELLLQPISNIETYDTKLALEAKSKQRKNFRKRSANSFVGYYPVQLGFEQGELRKERRGIMFFLYDYSSTITQAKNSSYYEAILFIFIGLVIASGLSALLHYAITHRLSQINIVMEKVAKGEFEARINLDGKDEIAQLAKSFDKMIGQVDQESKTMQLMQYMVNNTSDLFFLIRPDSSFEYVNESCLANLGYSKDEFLKLKVMDIDINFTMDKWIPHWKELKQKKTITIETKHRSKTGRVISVEVVANFVEFDGKEYNCAFVRNITERKEAESKLHRQNQEYFALNEEYKAQNELLHETTQKAQESDKLKTSFLQNMSHEIRTPMNAIVGFSTFLSKNTTSPEQLKKFSNIVVNSSRQLLSIVNDILTISSIETQKEKLNPTEVCINDLLNELRLVFKQQAENRQIALYTRQALSATDSTIRTDKSKVTQIISNLISNALKFTHKGFIEIGYKVKAQNESDFLEFYVKDTGIGVKAEAQKEIFERFRQANSSISKDYGGTGLGLSISKGLVEILGGQIWIESEFGYGATFFFTIPYDCVCGNTTGKGEAEKDKPSILVAEDEEYNFLFIEEVLKERGLNIVHVKNGQEAINECQANPNICLVLMDIKMPVLDGYSAATEIKKTRPNLPIIAQSAYALERDLERFGNTFDSYITKPMTDNELNACINEFLPIS